MSRWYDGYYDRHSPREVKGGIRAHSRRGAFGESWWARRWIAVLEGFDIGPRLSRGRSYARRGQVVSIDISPGRVEAMVQGSRRKPYTVVIDIKPLPAEAWRKMAEVFSKRAIFAARLLAGEMPENIEEAFREAGLSLFPSGLREIKTECSCPDWSNPCKHVAAVYYLLGEEFDRDPFLIFKLRGVEPRELTGLIGAGDRGKEKATDAAAAPVVEGEDGHGAVEPLPSDPSVFWGRGAAGEAPPGLEAHIPAMHAALPRQLGPFPFWRGEEPFLDALEEVYDDAALEGLDIFLGGGSAPPPVPPPDSAADVEAEPASVPHPSPADLPGPGAEPSPAVRKKGRGRPGSRRKAP